MIRTVIFDIDNTLYSYDDAHKVAFAALLEYAEKNLHMTAEEFTKLGCGYRADYLVFAANEVASGRLDLAALAKLPTAEARKRLLEVYGIGPKVADCVLLYGLGKTECCPADVWIKRVICALGGSMPACVTDYAGIAQQFLFHYARNYPEKFVKNNE